MRPTSLLIGRHMCRPKPWNVALVGHELGSDAREKYTIATNHRNEVLIPRSVLVSFLASDWGRGNAGKKLVSEKVPIGLADSESRHEDPGFVRAVTAPWVERAVSERGRRSVR